jgi:hypothetical protein
MADYSERELYPGEESFFKERQDVGGMIAEDGKVIINPYSKLSDDERQAVFQNEKSRHLMRTGAVERPTFDITDRQREFFGKVQAGGKYGSDQDIRETIAARVLTGDPSAQDATQEQLAYAKKTLAEALATQRKGLINRKW